MWNVMARFAQESTTTVSEAMADPPTPEPPCSEEDLLQTASPQRVCPVGGGAAELNGMAVPMITQKYEQVGALL